MSFVSEEKNCKCRKGKRGEGRVTHANLSVTIIENGILRMEAMKIILRIIGSIVPLPYLQVVFLKQTCALLH